MAERVPPHNTDAERSLLGGVLMDPAAFDDVIEAVAAKDFYRDAHRVVFEAMTSLAGRGEPIDRVKVKDELQRLGTLEAAGGEDALDLLDKIVPTAANLAHYAKIVHEKALQRRTIEAAQAIVSLGYEQHGSVADYLDNAQKKIIDAAEDRLRAGGPVSGSEILLDTYRTIQANYERNSDITGIASGLTDLDKLTAGFQAGDLIVLAARPSMGKTACGVGWFQHVSIREKKTALLFSMEMGRQQIMLRMLASEGRVDGTRLRTGKLLESDWPKLAQASETIHRAKMEIDDSKNLTALEIRARARRVAKKHAGTDHPLSLIVVDYLTMMRTDDGPESLSSKVGSNARRLKDLAGELAVPVVLLAQLNREPAKGGKPRRPVLSDLRDSGEIEQHADVAIFIHAENDATQLVVEKQRNGPIGIVGVSFRPEFTRFDNLARGSGYGTHYTQQEDAA